MSSVKTTKHASLQAQLNSWHDILLRVNESRRTLDVSTTDGLRALRTLMDEFVTSFVPSDIDEEDMSHYANNLITDEVESAHHNLAPAMFSNHSITLPFGRFRNSLPHWFAR